MKNKSKKRKASDDEEDEVPSAKAKRTESTSGADEDFVCEVNSLFEIIFIIHHSYLITATTSPVVDLKLVSCFTSIIVYFLL